MELLAPDGDILERAILVQWNRGMIEQIAVGDRVEATIAEHALHVLAQLLALGKGLMELLDNGFLLRREFIRMLGIHRREIGIQQLIFLATNLDDALAQVHFVHEQAVFHPKVGTTLDGSSLKLELDDADGLVHLRHELRRAGTLGILGTAVLGQETLTGVACIGVHGKRGQRQQIDAVTVLKHTMVAIAQGDAQHIGNTAIVTGSRTHPQDVMVTPLDVKVVEPAQDIHDLVGAGATVIDVAQDVQHVDGELLDEVTHRDDEFIDAVSRDDGLDNHIDIGLLVGVAAVLVQQLLDNVGEVLGQRLVNLGTAILGRHMTTNPDQTVNRDEVPVIQIFLVGNFLLDKFQLLGRIVNKSTQFLLLTSAQ